MYIAQLLCIVLTLMSLGIPPNPYVLDYVIDVKANPSQETETEYVSASLLDQVKVGNLDPMAEYGGTKLTVRVKWIKSSTSELEGIRIFYEAGAFKGTIFRTTKDLPVGTPLPPKYEEFANLVVQDLVREWSAYKQHARMVAKGHEGAPKP